MATPIPSNRVRFTAWEVAAATGGAVTQLARDAKASVGFVTDSRALSSGMAFVALRGVTMDGHAFLGEAVARGASMLLLGEGNAAPQGSDVDVVTVADTLTAWGALARAHLRRWRRLGPPARRTVAITGSTGKTTTKNLCASLLGQVGTCHSTTGNLNNRIGVPAVALGVESATRFAVFEVGMSERGEIGALAAVVEPDVAVLLNVGVAHAGGVGGRRSDVAREKGALIEALGPEGVAVLNADDDAARAQAMRAPGRVVTFGRTAGASYRLLERVSLGPDGSRVTLDRNGEKLRCEVPLLGEGAALDFLSALAACDAVRARPLPAKAVRGALASCRAADGRACVVRLAGDIVVLDDTYNANPASMGAALDTLSEVARPARRKVAVLGEMKELGPLAEAEHEALGARLARAGVDLVVGCGGLMNVTLARAASLGVTARAAQTTEEAAEIARREVRGGDALLLKGSRSVGVERVLQALLAEHGRAKAAVARAPRARAARGRA